ncbi:MAG: peptide deformylase [Paracoccaceae bacterium]
MSLRPILTPPDARLRQVAAPVMLFDAALRELADEMIAIMYAAPGRGLAAPQIGELRRLFVMDAGWKDTGRRAPRVMVNPEIVSAGDATRVMDEGCLSLPGVIVPVQRPSEVTLRWQDLDGTPHEETFTGFAAPCVQHERDHLDGILCTDYLPEDARAAALDRLEPRP